MPDMSHNRMDKMSLFLKYSQEGLEYQILGYIMQSPRFFMRMSFRPDMNQFSYTPFMSVRRLLFNWVLAC